MVFWFVLEKQRAKRFFKDEEEKDEQRFLFNMLPKKNRADKNIVKRVFAEGRFVNSENLTFKYVLDKENHIPMVSFVVPKTVSKKAVARNLLRRRGYSLLEKYFNEIPKNTLGVFILGKKSLATFGGKGKIKKTISLLNFNKEIRQILKRL